VGEIISRKGEKNAKKTKFALPRQEFRALRFLFISLNLRQVGL
jgi:hypothetical protein